MPDATRILFGTTHHPDAGRYEVRHLMDESYRSIPVSLCGRYMGYVYDFATPLLPDCKQCAIQARTRDAAIKW